MARTLKRKRTRRHKRKRNNNAITVKKGGGFFDFFYKTNDQPMFNKKNFTDPRSDKQIKREYSDYLDKNRDSMATQRYLPDVMENLKDLPDLSDRIGDLYEENEEGAGNTQYIGQAAEKAYKAAVNPQPGIIISEYPEDQRVDLHEMRKSKKTSVKKKLIYVLILSVPIVAIGALTEYLINSKHVHSS
jgi:hypothetical protein